VCFAMPTFFLLKWGPSHPCCQIDVCKVVHGVLVVILMLMGLLNCWLWSFVSSFFFILSILRSLSVLLTFFK
jgi:hypothetical protein